MSGSNINLVAKQRKKSRNETKLMRREGFVPGVVYGRGIENVLVRVEGVELTKVFKEAGEHTLVDLAIGEGEKRTVLIHDIDRDPVRGIPTHVDFYQVRLDEKVTTEVPLEFVGVSRAVKELGGTLVKSLTAIEIEALPGDIPHQINVDISAINTFDDHVAIKDLPVSAGVTILEPAETIIVSVVPPRSEAELEELESAVIEDVTAVGDVEEKEKLDEPEGDQPEPQEESSGATEDK